VFLLRLSCTPDLDVAPLSHGRIHTDRRM